MKTKSKVTSVRVEPELYEKFKSILESQNKQVSDSVSEFIENHVMINKAVNELMARCDGLIKPISEYKNLGWYRVITYGNITESSKEDIQKIIKDELHLMTENIKLENVRMYFVGVSWNGYLNFILAEELSENNLQCVKQLLDKFAGRLARGLNQEVEMKIAVPKPWFNEMKKFDGAKLNAFAVLELSEVRLPEYPNFIFHFCDVKEPIIAKIEKNSSK